MKRRLRPLLLATKGEAWLCNRARRAGRASALARLRRVAERANTFPSKARAYVAGYDCGYRAAYKRHYEYWRRRLAFEREELAHWKVCMNCGEPLAGPGICSQAVSEHEKGLELMLQEALDRAEQAETRVQALEAQIAALTQECEEK